MWSSVLVAALLAPVVRPGMVPECETGWSLYDKSCYRFEGASLTWSDASQNCKQQGSVLAEIPDQLHSNFLSRQVTSYTWFGLNDLQQEGVWRYGDKNATYFNWNSGEPHPRYGEWEDCVMLFPLNTVQNGRWNDYPCSKRLPSICSKDANVVMSTNTTSPSKESANYSCPAGWSRYSDMCYKYIPTTGTWYDGKCSCRLSGGEMARIPDRYHNDFVVSVVMTEKAWIGAHDTSAEWHWMYGKSDHVPFFNWGKGEPNNAGDEDCVEFYKRGGLWNDKSCESPAPALCSRPVDSSSSMFATTTPLPFPTTAVAGVTDAQAITDVVKSGTLPETNIIYACEAGWKLYGKKCYRFQSSTWPWYLASARCWAQGGSLAEIPDQNHNNFLARQITTAHWIGLSDLKAEGRWHYGTKRATYFNWNWGEPNNAGNEDCTMLYPLNTKQNGRWNDAKCAARMYSICSKDARIAAKTSSRRLTVTHTCPAGWTRYSDMCYQYIPSIGNWYDARCSCQINGGELARIPDMAHNNFVKGLFDKERAWIGAHDVGREWNWVYGKSDYVTFFNWDKGEPNNGGNEDCAEIKSSNGRWNDNKCTRQFPAVCSRPSDKLIVPSASGHEEETTDHEITSGDIVHEATTRAISSGRPPACDPGWLLYDRKCYRFVRSRMIWFLASLGCRQQGGTLAEIPDQAHNNFLARQITTPYWFGLSDMGVERVWLYGTKRAAYYNWNWGEPNDFGNEDCAMLHPLNTKQNGRWNDGSCSALLPSICSKNANWVGDETTVADHTRIYGCPAGWQRFSDMCYRYVPEPASWYDGNRTCHLQGGELARIPDKNHNDFIAGLLTSKRAWFGLHDIGREWHWVYGKSDPVQFFYWSTGEPNNYGNSNEEDCAEIDPNRNNRWNDFICNSRSPFICSRHVEEVKTTVTMTTDETLTTVSAKKRMTTVAALPGTEANPAKKVTKSLSNLKIGTTGGVAVRRTAVQGISAVPLVVIPTIIFLVAIAAVAILTYRKWRNRPMDTQYVRWTASATED